MKNKIIIGFALTLLLFISSIALASYAYQPKKQEPLNFQAIYDQAIIEEKECYESLESNPERIGECVTKKISRIDKNINLALWKIERLINMSEVMIDFIVPEGSNRWKEQERLNKIIFDLNKERSELIDFTRAL